MHKVSDIINNSLANARVLVQENLRDSDAWLIRGILAIYDSQTADEQDLECTKHDNGVGFSGVDAQILSSFAQQIQRHKADPSPRFRSPLSPRQLEIGRAKLHKYAMQLVRIARQNYATKLEAERHQVEKEQYAIEQAQIVAESRI